MVDWLLDINKDENMTTEIQSFIHPAENLTYACGVQYEVNRPKSSRAFILKISESGKLHFLYTFGEDVAFDACKAISFDQAK